MALPRINSYVLSQCSTWERTFFFLFCMEIRLLLTTGKLLHTILEIALGRIIQRLPVQPQGVLTGLSFLHKFHFNITDTLSFAGGMLQSGHHVLKPAAGEVKHEVSSADKERPPMKWKSYRTPPVQQKLSRSFPRRMKFVM